MTNERVAGCFTYSATDVLGHGDDGGIQIGASDGGFWIRHIGRADASASASADAPIELDWFTEVKHGYDVTMLHNKLAAAYAPNLYLRAPSTAVGDQITLYWNGTWDLSCGGHGIERFRYLESDAKVTLQWKSGSHRFILFDEPKSGCTQDAYDFVLGSATEKANRDSYNLTIDGGVDGPTQDPNDNLIEVRARGGVNGYDVVVRANFRNSDRGGLRVIGVPGNYNNVTVGGRYESAPILLSGAELIELEDTVYYSDPYARWAGWTGSGSSTDYYSYGAHDFKNEFKHSSRLEGAIEMQYGGVHWFVSNVAYLGTSSTDPFVMIGKDMGKLGPGSGSPGTQIDKPSGVGTQWGKTDPITVNSSPTDGQRFWLMKHGPHQYGSTPGWASGPKLEATADGTGCTDGSLYYRNAYTEFTLVNIDGNFNTAVLDHCAGTNAAESYGHTFRSENSGPAMVDGSTLQLGGWDNVVSGGSWETIHVRRDTYLDARDPAVYYSCDNNVIRNAILNHNVKVDGECKGTSISDVTWQGDPRTMMTIGSGADVTATNISAPVGSTIEGSGTLVLNGSTVALPYTIDGSEGSGTDIGNTGDGITGEGDTGDGITEEGDTGDGITEEEDTGDGITEEEDIDTNTAPVAHDQSVSTEMAVDVSITLSASDADGDPLAYEVVSPPSHGTLTGEAPNLTYMPNSGYVGSDSFAFRAYDGQTYSNEAAVSISVDPNSAVLETGTEFLDFGSVEIGSTATLDLQLSNSGDADLEITDVQIDGGESEEFGHDFDGSIALVPGSSHALALSFSPSSTGSKSASLTLTHSGENSPLTVSLEGEGSSSTGSLAVLSFTLINADTDEDIGPLADGDTLNLSLLPTRNLNVRANTSPATVGLVIFGLDKRSNYRRDSAAPYALGGENAGDYKSWTPALGGHRLTATPYTKPGGNSEAGDALTVNFTVIESGNDGAQARLHQNYPNPFNPSTEISFNVQESGPVRLAVYDAMGRRVKLLVNSQTVNTGRHSVRFDANDLASGIYVYTLETPTRVVSRTMHLVK